MQVVDTSGLLLHSGARTGKCKNAHMPRFFFNLYDDVDTLDEEGMELRDRQAAEAYAIECARSIAAEQVIQGKLTLSHRIELADESGEVVKTIRFSDAVEIVT